MTLRRGLLVVGCLLVPAAIAALDGPHSGVFGEDCSSCHTLHNAPGASLTSRNGNPNLCFACHNGPENDPYFGKWNALTAQAVPGTSGHSHSWSGVATGQGATLPPADSPMGLRLPDGNLQCSTCHDQHNNDESAGGTLRVSAVTAESAFGSVTLRSVPVDPKLRGTVLQIVAGGDVGQATFRVSHDGRSWWGWDPDPVNTWAPSLATGKPTGTAVALDEAGLDVDFAGTFAPGERFRFSFSRAFLRVQNAEAAMCTTCHRNMDQRHDNVEGQGTIPGTGEVVAPGTTWFNHPVGEGLNVNGRGYDRATLVEPTGVPQQGGGDGIGTNDLVLSGTSKVTCLTCHAPHNADSNSLSEDTR